MKQCNGCGHEKERVAYTAYRLDHSRVQGLCKECKERIEKEDMDSDTLKALSTLCDIINGSNAKDLAESMFRSINCQHRDLQNALFQTFVHFFKLYGEQDENHRDARNEWAVAAAKHWHNAYYDIVVRSSKDGN